MSLPSLAETMKTHGLEPKKSLGQHFLLDQNLTDKIALAAGSLENCTVIEIGPGPGGLTRSLLALGATVIAIEKDQRCAAALKELQTHYPNKLTIVEADALEIDESEFGSPLKIVANLPYNISTELLTKWLDSPHLYAKLTLMFQKEVADRISAKPGGKNYGRLSVLAQWLCDIQHEFDIGAQAFTPPPKVDSTVISLTPRETPLHPANKDMLQKICKATFGQRRKMLRASLKQLVKNPEELLEKAAINPELRPEQLDIAQFCALANAYDALTGA